MTLSSPVWKSAPKLMIGLLQNRFLPGVAKILLPLARVLTKELVVSAVQLQAESLSDKESHRRKDEPKPLE